MADEETRTPGPGEVGEGTPSPEEGVNPVLTKRQKFVQAFKQRRNEFRAEARAEFDAIDKDDEDQRLGLVEKAKNKLDEVLLDPAKEKSEIAVKEAGLRLITYLEEGVFPYIDEASKVALIALVQSRWPGRKSMIAAEVLNRVVGKVLTDKAYDVTAKIKESIGELSHEITDSDGQEILQKIEEFVDDQIEEQEYKRVALERSNEIMAEHGSKKRMFTAEVRGLDFSDEYKKSLKEQIINEFVARGFDRELDPSWFDSRVDEEITSRLRMAKLNDFEEVLDSFESEFNHLEAIDASQDEIDKLYFKFIASLNTESLRKKYSADKIDSLLKIVKSKEFLKSISSDKLANAERVLENLAHANFPMDAETERLIRMLDDPVATLDYIAEVTSTLKAAGMAEQDALEIAWTTFYSSLDDYTDRILSNTAVKHDEQFRLDQYEGNAYKGIQNLVVSLGNRVSKYLEDLANNPDPGAPKEFTRHGVSINKNTTVTITDIDRDHVTREDHLPMGVAISEWMANRVSGNKDRVTVMHNITYALTQGAEIGEMKKYAEQKLSAEFVQRLFLANPDYDLGRQELLRAMTEEIARNDGQIPDDFGLRNDNGLDSVSQTAFTNLLSLIPKKDKETETQHRNRVLQALRGGTVIAYAYSADAFHILKHALPRMGIKLDANGNVDYSIVAQQTHSQTYLKVASKLIPFFYHFLYKSPPELDFVSHMYMPRYDDEYLASGGPEKEKFGVESLLTVQQERDNSMLYGSSELLRRLDEEMMFLLEMEDSKKMGATQTLKMGDVKRFEALKITEVSSPEDIHAVLDSLRYVGSGHVFTYISKNLIDSDTNELKVFARNYRARPDAERRLGQRDKSTRELQQALIDANQRLHRTKIAASTSKLSEEYQHALAEQSKALRQFMVRLIELEVAQPIRDAMPSVMVSTERKREDSDYELFMDKRARNMLHSAMKGFPSISAFTSTTRGKTSEGKAFVDSRLFDMALQTQSALETALMNVNRQRYRDAVNSGSMSRRDAALTYLSQNALAFTLDHYNDMELQNVVREQFKNFKAESLGSAGIKITDIFATPDEYIDFIRSFGAELQYAVGDYNDTVDQQLQDRGKHPRDSLQANIRFEYYSEDQAWHQGPRQDVSRALAEIRLIDELYEAADISKSDRVRKPLTAAVLTPAVIHDAEAFLHHDKAYHVARSANGSLSREERQQSKDMIKQIDYKLGLLGQVDRVKNWVEASSGVYQNRQGFVLQQDSLARRLAMRLVRNDKSIRTDTFNRDLVLAEANLMSAGGNFGVKQLGHGEFEEEASKQATQIWLKDIRRAVLTAKSGGEDRIEKAVETLIGGGIGKLAEAWDGKDALEAPNEMIRRIWMIQRMIQRKPKRERLGGGTMGKYEFVSSDIVRSSLVSNDAESPMQLAYPSSPSRPVFAPDLHDMERISMEMEKDLSPTVFIHPNALSRSRRKFIDVTTHASDRIVTALPIDVAVQKFTQPVAQKIDNLGARFEGTTRTDVLGSISQWFGGKVRSTGQLIPTQVDVLETKLISVMDKIPGFSSRTKRKPVYRLNAANSDRRRKLMGTSMENSEYAKEKIPLLIASGIALMILIAMYIKKQSEGDVK